MLSVQNIPSPQAMLDFAWIQAQKNTKILLHGDLGAGKTLFTKGFAKALWINEDKVQSPTYTYINIYNKKLLHIDMYRLESFDDVLNKGILEEIHNYDYIVIERPKFEDQIDYSDFLKINIQKISDTERKLILW